MSRAQKIARFNLIVMLTSLILSTIAVSILYFVVGLPMRRALGGLGCLIFRKDKSKVRWDERDGLIKNRAALAGFGASYLVVCLACMVPFFVLGPKATVLVVWLPVVFGAAGLTLFFVHSVAMLVQYGWRDKGEKS